MKLGSIVKKLRLESNSVLIIKEDCELAEPTMLQRIQDELAKTKVENILVVVTKDLDDMNVAGEKQMNLHGWYRIAQIMKMIHKEETK